MRKRGASNLTAAIKLALQHEIERADEAVPLRQHVAEIRARGLAKAKFPPAAPLTREERDALWGQ
ncbi:hypothetical protein RsS93_63730 [Rhizobium dioscoreae]|uniref:Uncharacterized protein n=2 Tax=Rhizobium/Agrobacterium group TaxID=227290 RepID=A0ABQ0ZE60_9HYPH|nr:hypothetical protein RsS93_63730 [Rhizobium dioscoreae]